MIDIQVIEGRYPNYVNFMLNNLPVIIQDIPCSSIATIFSNNDGSLNYQGILQTFSTTTVPVDLPISSTEAAYGISTRVQMLIPEFLNRCVNGMESLYCKDWHIAKEKLIALDSLELFMDDWFNWYYDWRYDEDDYRFLYMGGPKTYTCVHHDILCSYSWSVNLVGKKRWHLWPPSDASLLTSTYVCHSSPASSLFPQSETVINATEGHYDETKFPFVKSAKRFIVEQGVGEVLFVPSGWYHMVENLSDDQRQSQSHNGVSTTSSTCSSATSSMTVSLNHNWFNGFSVYEVWKYLLRALNIIRIELWNLLAKQEQASLENKSKDTGHEAGRYMRGSLMHTNDLAGCMTRVEWLSHCEVLLRANDALNMRQLMELISSRVVMMQVVSLRIGAVPPEEASMLGSFHDRNWRRIFCPEYHCNHLMTDVLFSLLTTTAVPSLPSDEYFPSTYYESCNRRYPSSSLPHSSLSLKKPHEEPEVIACESEGIGTFCNRLNARPLGRRSSAESLPFISFPMSVMQFSLLQIAQIVFEISSSIEMVGHIAVSTAPIEDLVGWTDLPTDTVYACLSEFLDDLICLIRVMYLIKDVK